LRGDGSELGAERCEEHQVVQDAVHLDHDHAHVLRTTRYLDLHELLDGHPHRQLVADAGQPVHTRNQVRDLTVVARFDKLLVAAVHVSDDRFGLDEDLAVDRREKTEHTVRRRVLRSDVEDHLLRFEGA
jgi:hypothetical protein